MSENLVQATVSSVDSMRPFFFNTTKDEIGRIYDPVPLVQVKEFNGLKFHVLTHCVMYGQLSSLQYL